MAKNNFSYYENARSYLRDKDKNVKSYVDYMFSRTNEMFIYNGLPDTIPARNLEYLLQRYGRAFITDKPDGTLYAFNGSYGGELDVYNEPTRVNIVSPALKYSGDLDIKNDGVLMRNDSANAGLFPTVAKYGAMLCDTEISLNLVSILMRITVLLSACDDKTKESAEMFIKKIIDGEYSVIGETAFFDGVKMQNAQASNGALITQFIELNQYIKAQAFNEIGLNANFNMKRERLNLGEIELNNNALIPLTQNMLNCRREAIEKINEKYDLDISVDLSGVWRAEKEQVESAIMATDTETVLDAENAPAEIDLDLENKGVENEKTVSNMGRENLNSTVENDNKSGSVDSSTDNRSSEKRESEKTNETEETDKNENDEINDDNDAGNDETDAGNDETDAENDEKKKDADKK